ncbi:hypothetical protein A5893_15950 [Pedobacter psychrophilus]|uniref:3-keto-disaccharide hydrolase domain-containing protein n=1 Tax=Pedobacter psychrophilus TaxID=1826909 RepID=A0A179DC59_9SPHI|nr:hypothetical protein [Pedobacter psychrophilus]OAQ38280.1 hypothetical protein A5893_15950 [Pedobacter psychrophilus]
MNKKTLLFISLVALACSANAQSQTWKYDFGETEATFNPNPGQISTSFLPKPGLNTSKTLKQVARVRTGSDGTGELNLVKTGANFIKGVGLEIVPAVANSKFSIYNIEGTALSSMSFQIKFDGSNIGQFMFANGNSTDKEDLFQGNSNIKETNTEIFVGLRWNLTEANEIKFYNRVENKWIGVKGISFLKNTEYNIEVFSNNSLTEETYKKEGDHILKANTYEVWVNGKKAITSVGGLTPAAIINAFTIVGYKPKDTEVKPKLWVDNLTYSDHL